LNALIVSVLFLGNDSVLDIQAMQE